ncbi:DegV family protein [Lactobacillus sp. DCY120]|uniref:DegV family protein n=1 Tax=Bombilactobacillus apium TaxID=2675299 RepID=A0A850QVU6_9LACO|nr:DegV family protein [Bombilactobacillus apium]NVY95914.1 DegV family protein [Bombilactobacillus apium]
MIHIVTDSTAQLTDQEIRTNHITVIPLTVTLNGKNYRDKIDINRNEFSKQLKTNSKFPQTSQPSVGDFIETYKWLFQPGDQIISIHIGAVLSGTVKTAQMAANQLTTPIKILDSGLTDRGLGLVVLKAAKLAQSQTTAEKIILQLKKYISQITLTCFVNSLDYLVKGGRANRATGFISSLINLKLELAMSNGELKVVHKARGKHGMQKLINQVIDIITKDPQITQVGLSYVDSHQDTDAIETTLRNQRPDLKIINQLTSPTIMTHVGPKGFAIIFA